MANGKHRPGIIINWYDESETTNVIEETLVRPLYLQLFTSDKGPEDLHTVHGNEFFNLYGSKPSYKKHGQPLIQAAEIIKAGGEILCKRVVASDAALANLVLVAKVSTELIQKVDEVGNPLFIDADTGKETTNSNNGANERAMINSAKIKYDAVSIKGAKTLREVKIYGSKLLKDHLSETTTDYDHITKVGDALTDQNPVGDINDGDEDANKYIYPLFVVTDNGRGVSSKRFNITPDYTISKGIKFQLYKLNYLADSAQENEYVWFNFQDDIIYLNKNRSLEMIGKDLTQIRASSFDDSIDLFVQRLSQITGVDEDEINAIDPLFGCNRKGEQLQQITIDNEGYNLDSALGMMLQEGNNGSFGDTPIEAATYPEEFVKVFDGEFDDSIFDRDRFLIDVCCDANYPPEVKKAIYDLAVFREDFVFFRDYGTDIETFDQIRNMALELPKTKFVADYCQNWDIMDPWTRKQITVTAPFNMAIKMVNNLISKRSAPLCGILHGFVFDNVIEGTENYLPKILPSVDQKELLCDLNINYASYINGALTMETTYTTQEGNTQLSYINNILAVTQVIHAIKTECPKIRYSFITDTDLSYYQNAVNKLIMQYASNFADIKMEYTQDEIMAANKIFEANLYVKFKNFEQEEIFNIYTLS